MKTEKQLLSAHEAACVTGIPTKQVRRIIDAGLLREFVKKPNGTRTRMISKRALVGLKLAYETNEILTLEGKRRLVRRVLEDPDATTVREESISVDVSSMKEDVDRGIALLEQAKKSSSATRKSSAACHVSKVRGLPSTTLPQCGKVETRLIRFSRPAQR